MIRLYRNKNTGAWKVVENRNGKELETDFNPGEEIQARAFVKKLRRNAILRERNAILRELTGTSARAAREDMGLGPVRTY